ncbi:hypothetical protein AT48_00070 [Streptococcus equi subsp. zooepidemicus SzAM60]|nr:hypothetical protein AT48_00070 [Streptococcus equi subsp. zooepidemicus SzAM60]
MKNIDEKILMQKKKSSSYKTKEKSSLVSRNRKNEKKEIDGFMKKEQSLKVFLQKVRTSPKMNFIS